MTRLMVSVPLLLPPPTVDTVVEKGSYTDDDDDDIVAAAAAVVVVAGSDVANNNDDVANNFGLGVSWNDISSVNNPYQRHRRNSSKFLTPSSSPPPVVVLLVLFTIFGCDLPNVSSPYNAPIKQLVNALPTMDLACDIIIRLFQQSYYYCHQRLQLMMPWLMLAIV